MAKWIPAYPYVPTKPPHLVLGETQSRVLRPETVSRRPARQPPEELRGAVLNSDPVAAGKSVVLSEPDRNRISRRSLSAPSIAGDRRQSRAPRLKRAILRQ